jgi:iron complex transport system substrate-binding protein
VRVVSHTCSNTEIVCALGCRHMLVGVDDHSDYPVEAVRDLPRIGPDLSVDVERVKQLKPDLVLSSLTVPGHERIVAALEAAQLPLLVVEPISLEDVYGNIETIAETLGVGSRGRDLVARMREAIGITAGALTPKLSILIEWWPKPVIVPGRRSWVSDMLTAVGAENPWIDYECKSTPISDEQAIAADPDAIVLSWCGVQPEKVRPSVVRRRQTWRDIRAVRKNCIYCVPEAWMGRPGPRLLEGINALRTIVTQLAV